MGNLLNTSLRNSSLQLEDFIIIYSVILLYSKRKVVKDAALFHATRRKKNKKKAQLTSEYSITLHSTSYNTAVCKEQTQMYCKLSS